VAKLKVYDITKELNDSTKQLLEKFRDTCKKMDEHIQAIQLLEQEIIEEARKKERERAKKPEETKNKAVEVAERTIIPKDNDKQGSEESMKEKKQTTSEESNGIKQDSRENRSESRKNHPTARQQVAKQHTSRGQSSLQSTLGEPQRSPESNGGTKLNQTKQESRNAQKRGGNQNENVNKGQGHSSQQPAHSSKQEKTNTDNRDRRSRSLNKRISIDKVIAVEVSPPMEKEKVSNYDPNRSNYVRNYDSEKKTRSKRTIKEAIIARDFDDDQPRGSRRKQKNKKTASKAPTKSPAPEPIKIEKAVITGETVMIKELAEKIGKPATEIIKKLMILGVMATINQDIDFDTAALVASEFGVELEQKLEKTYEEVLIEEYKKDTPEDLSERPPVVTVMGHVDHGKTSLLDAIRKSKVTEREAGGITQHIGAYTIEINNKQITFLDTPGHEAFTAMRARGAQVTDIAILVVAADDGVMPQTIEAINHAKAANVPIIVAINKIDKEIANPERVKQELTEYGLVAEEWGGDSIFVPVSAITQEGIDHLLEMILLVSEIQELKANPNRLAKGTIIEAKLDKGRGPVATVLVQNGTLKVGDPIVAGVSYGHVRAMINDKGKRVDSAGPSQPVEVLGFSEVPEAGDILYAVEDEKLSRHVSEERKDKIKAMQIKAMAKVSLDDLFNQIAEGQIKELNIIVKGDVQGSVEAVKQSIEKLSNEQVRVKTIHEGVGGITESDVMLASASNAIIIGFNVRPDSMARTAAEREKVDIRLYRVIYNAIEDIEKAMKGLLEPEFKEVILGHAEVRATFKVSGVGTVAGTYVTDGKILRNANARLVRNGVVVYEGKVASLKRFKDDAREVASGYECGIGLENFNDIKDGDVIEAYIEEEVVQ
jgi:translation initiation factor IF-2